MSTIELIHEDCLEEMSKIPTGSIDMIFCDLPQNITKNHWDVIIPFEPLWKEYERVIKDNGAIILTANAPFTYELGQSNRKLFRYSMVWEKTSPTNPFNAKRMPLRSHEDILVFYKKLPNYYPQKTTRHPRKVSTAHHKRNSVKSSNYGDHKLTSYDSTERYPKSVLTFKTDKQKSTLSPTQKPVALIEWFIKSFTVEEERILDNCAGSGSTGEACRNTNRDCILIEKKNEIEYNKAKQRLKL